MRIRIVVDGKEFVSVSSATATAKQTADQLYEAIDTITKLQFTLENGQELVLGPGMLQRTYFILED